MDIDINIAHATIKPLDNSTDLVSSVQSVCTATKCKCIDTCKKDLIKIKK